MKNLGVAKALLALSSDLVKRREESAPYVAMQITRHVEDWFRALERLS